MDWTDHDASVVPLCFTRVMTSGYGRPLATLCPHCAALVHASQEAVEVHAAYHGRDWKIEGALHDALYGD